ncbi:MAG TPA: putative zinc-binding metallopeptidase [Thermoanaerobaculia bacterium]|nr:putative zinc-binding metallopeptidase [Thermoanaerobaculia bacterium]
MSDFEKSPPEARELLLKPIRELGLKIEGTPVEKFIQKLYGELERKGLQHFRPAFYLTDQWGCPDEEPVIGVPFYLADPALAALEKSINDLETDREIMRYMRHEAGHAFNYAYELYKTDEWRDIFGPFRRAYRDEYNPIPFSKKFVRHIEGWYAQKHPDEDFAETFAVWLTPGSGWKKRYAGWGALRKLQYVDRKAEEVATLPPVKPLGEIDYTVDDLEESLEEFYLDTATDDREAIADLALDSDLADIFLEPSPEAEPNHRAAAKLVAENRKAIIDHVTYWTGVRRSLVKILVEEIQRRVEELGLLVEPHKESSRLVELTTYATTLAMNYLTRGRFVHP